MKLIWTSRSANTKTGDIPTAWPDSKEECISSCKKSGCPLFTKKASDKLGLKTCYAHRGRVNMAYASVLRAFKKDPERYAMENAFGKANRAARVARITAYGNVGIMTSEQIENVKKGLHRWNLGMLGYFYGWKLYPHLKDYLMASTVTMKSADRATKAGFRATTVLPRDFDKEVFETPDQNIGLQCPAIFHKNIQCNQCGLCVREWNPVKQLKRLVSLDVISEKVYKRIAKHPKASQLIIGFTSHD